MALLLQYRVNKEIIKTTNDDIINRLPKERQKSNRKNDIIRIIYEKVLRIEKINFKNNNGETNEELTDFAITVIEEILILKYNPPLNSQLKSDKKNNSNG